MAEPRVAPEIAELPEIVDLVEQHTPLLYRYAYRLAGNSSDAEDLCQQTFLSAQQHLGQLRQAEQARSWLCTILRRHYLAWRKKRLPMPAAALDLELDQFAAAEPPLDLDLDAEKLQLALDQLPEEFKLVVVMYYLEDCSYRDIAERLGIPLGTVMSRLSRGKAQLRARLLEPARVGS